MGYYNAEKMDAQPKTEIEAVMSECQPHLDEFYKSGQVMIDAGLETETKSLRRENGKITVTDRPFTETKELIGSVFLIEAKDMEEAIQIASLHPTTQVNAPEEFGWRLEIHPVHYFKKSEQYV
jgi:hypothetical protein